jgi:NADH-quinone oxidoreductase subunit G
MSKQITLKIDGRSATVPEGMLIVDAAKSIGITIPVFCHHPKLEPVGMCRMCLVDIGRPQIDRTTGAPLLNEDGSVKVVFGPKLETACTTPVSEGMVVWGTTEKVMAARKEVLEFLLTSHPLDCPVCDKGGECPLQNQTMAFGPSESRFLLDEKSRAKKHVPLGELIFLDRERCIQCARCVRFQDQIVDDPVIGFYNRGRALEIVTYSEPGFDSIFSGNTTDICPVGALTTTDFRFGARPWELKHKASICTQCPVGCNITYDVRREARSDGKTVIKRVMPRQNEEVNEIWVCDKGRFAYSYVESKDRICEPMIRKDGELVPVSWEEAVQFASEKIRTAGKNLTALVSGRLSNEDLFSVKTLTDALGAKTTLYSSMGGGDWVSRVGMSPGSDLGKLEKGSTILVMASDLHEAAPIWWLRVKQAQERGATLIVVNPRTTRLDKYSTHIARYSYGEEAKALREVFEWEGELTQSITQTENLVVFLGSEGMGLAQSTALAGLCAEMLVKSNHFGKPNNGLIPVCPRANDQGAWELGIQTDLNLVESLNSAMGVYVIGADPAGDEPALRDAIQRAGFVIVQDLFLTETAKLADVVFPAQAVMEREGSVVSGERRVQRFSAAIPPLKGTRPDHAIAAALIKKTESGQIPDSVSSIFDLIVANVPNFKSISYQTMAGLGVTLPLANGADNLPTAVQMPEKVVIEKEQWLAVPVTKLYDQGILTSSSSLLRERIGEAFVKIHPIDAEKMNIENGSMVDLHIDGHEYPAKAVLTSNQPAGVLLVPRSFGIPLSQPAAVKLTVREPNSQQTERGGR